MKRLLLLSFTLLIMSICLTAQTSTNGYPKYRAGIDAGLNINFSGMGYQDLSPGGADFIEMATNDGLGFGPRIGLYGEYLSGHWWGLILRASYDSRNLLVVDESFDPTSEFDITANYLSFEPMLRIDQPFIPNLNARIGPLISLKLNAEYDFKEDESGDVTAAGVEIVQANDLTMGATFGLSYDILLNDVMSKQRWYLSPFLDMSYLLAQREPDFEDEQNILDDTWSTFTFALGVKASIEFVSDEELASFTSFDNINLSLPAKGIVRVREVEDFFPIVQHVFFDQGSQEIPDRYAVLTNEQASKFDEDVLKDLTQIDELASMRKTDKQMYMYYNVMNIFAHRMNENRNEDVRLIGSAPIAKDGEELANKVKDYLVNVFGIDENRILVEGREMPRVPSGTANTPADDRPATQVENRRVEFVFNNNEMYAPIKTKILDEASLDNDLIFSVNQGVEYDNWNVIITGEGKTVSYGPFYSSVERINPVELMRGIDRGTFTAKVVINEGTDQAVTEESQFILLKEVVKNRLGARYNVLFEYAQKDPIASNETLLRNDIAGAIDEGNRVIVHGHTDNLGKEQVNRELSFERARQAREVLADEFNISDKTIDVEAFGFGEFVMPSTFNNELPEGRFYNRNVIIEVIPLED